MVIGDSDQFGVRFRRHILQQVPDVIVIQAYDGESSLAAGLSVDERDGLKECE